MEQLLNVYKHSLRIVRNLQEKTKGEKQKIELKKLKDLSEDELSRRSEIDRELTLLGGMVSDLEFSIKWLKTGRNPNNFRRGAERPYSWNPVIIEQWYNSRDDDPYQMIDENNEDFQRVLTSDERFRIDQAMCTCTDREKLFYELSRINFMSLQEIADEFDVCKSTVQTTIERAEEKIKRELETNMFLI